MVFLGSPSCVFHLGMREHVRHRARNALEPSVNIFGVRHLVFVLVVNQKQAPGFYFAYLFRHKSNR